MNEEPIINNLLASEPELTEKAKQLVTDYQKLEASIEKNCEFPEITFFQLFNRLSCNYFLTLILENYGECNR